MKSFLVQFSRVFVGILFIISGLIKLNDPIGFSYKLVEYFSEPVFNIPFLVPFALFLALFIVILEVVLGVMLLIGYQSKITVKLLFALILMFTFLTFYSAYFDVVKDCGCFGDALHLTPWQSFTKDVVLLFFILILVFNYSLIKPLFHEKIQKILVLLTSGLCTFMAYWVLNHSPIIDFRPFKVGSNIQKGMEIPVEAQTPKVDMTFIYKVNGVDTEFKEADLMNLPEGATFVDRKDVVTKVVYNPPIHDFTMMKDGINYSDEFLNTPKLVVFVCYDLTKADKEGLEILEKLNLNAFKNGYTVIGLTGSSQTDIERVAIKYEYGFDFYYCDATTLKTIERANPSIVILNNGTVVKKAHYNDADQIDEYLNKNPNF
jgi:uncharacterized membrane protein YphA (DoxX/SURF4 family)